MRLLKTLIFGGFLKLRIKIANELAAWMIVNCLSPFYWR